MRNKLFFFRFHEFLNSKKSIFIRKYVTGKFSSEALSFATTNPQYDDRLFIESQVQYMKIPSSEQGKNMLCTEIVFDIQNNLCTQHVLLDISDKDPLHSHCYPVNYLPVIKGGRKLSHTMMSIY